MAPELQLSCCCYCCCHEDVLFRESCAERSVAAEALQGPRDLGPLQIKERNSRPNTVPSLQTGAAEKLLKLLAKSVSNEAWLGCPKTEKGVHLCQLKICLGDLILAELSLGYDVWRFPQASSPKALPVRRPQTPNLCEQNLLQIGRRKWQWTHACTCI